MSGPSDSERSLVFDLDGTLIDSASGIEWSLGAAFLSVGLQMPDVALRRFIGPPISAIARHLEPSLSDSEIADIARAYRRNYDTVGWRRVCAFAGVVETLERLRQRQIRLFVVTNKPRLPTEQILAHLEVQSFFEDVLSRDSRDPAYASKTEMLSSLLERHSLTTQTTYMVGDTIEDGDAAAANGLVFISASYGYGSVPSNPHSIDNFSELIALLDSIFLSQGSEALP